MKYAATAEQIDAVLPQTQCGLCGYNGCLPYAKALADRQARIDLCPPGGVSVLHKLATLLQQDVTPYLAAMNAKTKPTQVAVIREAECIGCTKCIQACPVDAILGSAKNMHTIIARDCTGCELCVAPCPVDCIDMVILPTSMSTGGQQKADLARGRYNSRQQRLAKNNSVATPKTINTLIENTIEDKKAFIQAALLRTKLKKAKN